MKIEVILVMDEETKGAVKYREQLPNGRLADYPNSPGAKVGIQYIRKVAFPNTTFPGVLKATFESVDEHERAASAIAR